MVETRVETNPESTNRAAEARPKVGIALGAGGAKGIAHISMLEALDELEIRPHRIAGSSIGAVIGAMYASGLSAEAIKAKIRELVVTKGRAIRDAFSQRKILKWIEIIEPGFRNSGLIKSESIIARQLRIRPPDIYIKLDLRGSRTLHFFKTEEIYEQAQPAKEQLKKKLQARLA